MTNLSRNFIIFILVLLIVPKHPSYTCDASCYESCDNGNEYSVCREGNTVKVATYDASEGQYTMSIYVFQEEEGADDQSDLACESLQETWCGF